MKKKMVFGIIVVLLGIFLLIDNMGFLPIWIRHVVFSWQILLVAIGIVLLADRKPIFGLVLILVGVCFLLSDNFVFPTNLMISIALIIVGVGLIIHAATGKNYKFYKSIYSLFVCHSDKKAFVGTIAGEEEFIHRNYVFSYSKEQWAYSKLKSIEIMAACSNVELDFVRVDLPEEEIHIKIKSVFSYVTLFVPTNWNVISQQKGAFGEFLDERLKNDIDLFDKKTVFLEIESMFSGGEIKSCVNQFS